MYFFFVLFFSLYGAAQYFFYRRFTRAVPLGAAGRRGIALLLVVATISPVLIRKLEAANHAKAATLLAYPAYCWLSVLFLFLVLSLAWSVIENFIPLFAVIRRRPQKNAHNAAAKRFFIPFTLAFLCSAYGLIEARGIRVEQVSITTGKLPQGVSRIRVAVVSDVHIGMLADDYRMRKIVTLVRQSEPDIFISAGDLADGYLTHDGEHLQLFRSITPRYGSYAIMGNHEYYVGVKHAAEIIQGAGFKLLRGETVSAGPIVLIGEDDRTGKRFGEYRELAAAGAGSDRFRLLLRHQPFTDPAPAADLQFSGHVHKGQIFPFNLVTWLRFRVPTGLSKLADGKLLYVGRGTGTWGPPIRFLAPPEVTIIDLVNQQIP